MKSVLRKLNRLLKKEGLPTISLKTFRKRIRAALTKYDETATREGNRAGYAIEDIDWSASDIPAHGDWPFHIVHIDHTQVDLELISSNTGKTVTKRLWLTLMIDAYSRRILAISVTFDPPSYRSLMNIMRECLKRHGRLPHTVVVDNGAEFDSIYFDTLLATCKILKIKRPPSSPRFGAVIERLIGTMNKTFLYNLWGNTQLSKAGRLKTKEVDPKNLAIWTPERFHARLLQWAHEIYDTVEHSSLDKMSPREAFERGMAITGCREHLLIPYDLDFIMLTFPSTPKGAAKVTRLGVKINNIWYSCAEFRKPGVLGEDVDVRYDPYDASVAYAYVNSEWKQCTSKYEKQFKGKSERDIKMYTDELRSRNHDSGKNFTVTDAILADFLAECEAEETELFQFKRQLEEENRKLLNLSELEKLLPKEDPVSEELPRSAQTDEININFELYEEVDV